MDKFIQKQTKKLEKQELNYISKPCNTPMNVINKKLEKAIPQGLQAKLNSAFYQGFKLVFAKGTKIIEKTYDKDKLQKIHQTKNYAYHNDLKKWALKQMDSSVTSTHLATMGLTAVEGTALGLLGIGLPDIPLFIGVLLKGIYEVALKYGYSYDCDEEKYYILMLIEATFSTEHKKVLNDVLEVTAKQIDLNLLPPFDLELQMRRTASTLANDMLYLKFIQGLPIIGAIGGAANAVYFNKMIRYAKVKYKKRYLTAQSADAD